MALFQIIKYNGPAHVLVWKHPAEDMNTGSRLVVNQSQDAVFVREGGICDVFGPGTYALDTSNLPILSGIVDLPFGRKSPFTAEVFFVNKLNILDIKWGTTVPVQLRDPVYNVVIPLRAFGQYGVAVEDSGQFLHKLVGTARSYTTEDLIEYFRGLVGSRIVDELAGYLLREQLSFLEASAHMTEIAQGITEAVGPFFAEYGIRLVNFCINSINAPESDPSVRKLRQVLDRKHELEVFQVDYRQERSFDVLERAAQHLDGAGGGMAGVGVGAAFGAAMADVVKQTMKTAAEPDAEEGFCAQCGGALRADAAFCPKCGRPVERGGPQCPKCGAECRSGDRFCAKCGQRLG